MQMKVSSADPRIYNPDRDVAHNMRFVATKLAEWLDRDRWDAVGEYIAFKKLSRDDTARALQALLLFIATTVQDKKEDITQAMERSGWNKVPKAAQLVIMAHLGTLMTGMYFVGARQATLGGEGPCSDVRELVALADDIARQIARPTLPRLGRAIWRRITGLFNGKFKHVN
jgi:hypothetical protein